MKSCRLLAALFCFLTFASTFPAYAAAPHQPGGVLAGIYIILVLGGFTLCNLPLQAMFYFNGQYRSAPLAMWHSLIALAVAFVGAAIVIYDHQSGADLTMYLGMVITAAGLSLLPILLQKTTKPAGATAGSKLLLASVIYFALALIWWPIALFTFAIALIAASWQAEKTVLFSVVRWLLACTALCWFVYHAIAFWQFIAG